MKTIRNFLNLVAALTSAVEANTKATTALQEPLARIEGHTASTASATAYLHRSEQHRREQRGERTAF